MFGYHERNAFTCCFNELTAEYNLARNWGSPR